MMLHSVRRAAYFIRNATHDIPASPLLLLGVGPIRIQAMVD